MQDRGIKCVMVGYASDHSSDTYEMLNWNTRRIMESRDVIWLNQMYFHDDLNNKEYKPNFQDSNSDNEGNNTANLSANSQAQPTMGTPMTTTKIGHQV